MVRSKETSVANGNASDAAAYYRGLLKPIFGGRRWIVIGGPIIGLAPLAASLRKLGALDCFLLGSFVGTGDVPGPEVGPRYSFDLTSKSVMEEFHRYEALLCAPPAVVCAALDAFDPDGSARVVGSIVLGHVPEVAGRRRYGGRPPDWIALEDKTVVETLWSAIGIRRAASNVVPPETAALMRASRELDRGKGCVWSGDTREGVHGGAEGVRWIRDSDDADEALRFFGPRCDRIRVMTFLEGIPCSIHGVVFPDAVIALRPVEMVVLRRPAGAGRSAFVYAGVGTWWDPPPGDRAEMRALARRVGEALRVRVGFRGPFTIDGVLTADGFRPTELNPRFGAGLAIVSSLLPTLPLPALSLAITEGECLDYRPEWLERVLLEAADANRTGRGGLPFERKQEQTETHGLVKEPAGYRFAADGEPRDATLRVGPGPVGGTLFFGPSAGHVPEGHSLAPFVVDACAFADRELATGFGPLEAPQVC